MTAECAECEKFEKHFIALRNERTGILLGGRVNGLVLDRLKALDGEEMAALVAIMDHKIEHRLSKG
jgi:hypothetical protein